MSIDEAFSEWVGKRRRMGCVSASAWFCERVPGFAPEHLTRYTEDGDLYGHVVATNGTVRVDLTPHLDSPAGDSR